MQRFSNTSREVAQSGRRGALMQTISVHHPEIMTFIGIKRDLTKVTGANISVRITDEFMEAVKKNKTYELRWPVDSEEPSIKSRMKAREVWDELVRSNYLSAEPGMLFWDNIIRNSPADSYDSLGFRTVSTNPCGELPLCVGDSCRLLVINLASYVLNPFTPEVKFDVKLFRDHVRKAQRLCDDLVELELEAVNKILRKIRNDPENNTVKENELSLWKEIKDKCKRGRRTGLGITGLGDCIAMLNVIYGSAESEKVVEDIYKMLRDEAYRSSIIMAQERGKFPIYDAALEKDNEFIKRLPADVRRDMKKHGRRNIGLLTTAPAGSTSTQTQTSSGFQSVFMVEYDRRRKLTDNEKPDFVDEMGDKWKVYKVTHHKAQLFKDVTGKKLKESPYAGAQAHEIDHRAMVRMQAIATQYVDHAISSTVNLPSDIDIDIVSDLYIDAWEQGCKGLTIYRDGSRQGVLVSSGTNSTRHCEDCDEASRDLIRLIEEGHRPKSIILASAPKRPTVVECDIQRSKVGGGDWLFFVGTVNGQPYEVFGGDSTEFTIPHKYKKGWIVKNGKIDGVTQYNLVLGSMEDDNEKLEFKGIAKHFNNYEYGAFTRLTSLTMRHGTPIKYICEQITKKGVEGDLFSFQRAMARILKKYIAEGEKSEMECPQCHGNQMYYKNGCPACKVCGYSNCA
jgi:ribonucleoside-diphosphate reductase alpha chain